MLPVCSALTAALMLASRSSGGAAVAAAVKEEGAEAAVKVARATSTDDAGVVTGRAGIGMLPKAVSCAAKNSRLEDCLIDGPSSSSGCTILFRLRNAMITGKGVDGCTQRAGVWLELGGKGANSHPDVQVNVGPDCPCVVLKDAENAWLGRWGRQGFPSLHKLRARGEKRPDEVDGTCPVFVHAVHVQEEAVIGAENRATIL